MPTFTFVIDYDGGTYISQSGGASPKAALRAWLRSFDFSVIPRLSTRAVQTLRREVCADTPTPVDSVRSVWCIGAALPRRYFMIHIIKTRVR